MNQGKPWPRPRLKRHEVDPVDLAIYLDALRGVRDCGSFEEHAEHMNAGMTKWDLTPRERAEFAKLIQEAR